MYEDPRTKLLERHRRRAAEQRHVVVVDIIVVAGAKRVALVSGLILQRLVEVILDDQRVRLVRVQRPEKSTNRISDMLNNSLDDADRRTTFV